MSIQNTQVLKEITKLENPYPTDNLIKEYRDFLKQRDYLQHYQFNPIVFKNLISLANELWLTNKRISRLSLLYAIKNYKEVLVKKEFGEFFFYSTNRNYILKLDSESTALIFRLVKLILENSEVLLQKQQEAILMLLYSILIGLRFDDNEEAWFIENFPKTANFINRIYYYPIKSKPYSKWALSNIENNSYIDKRSNLIGLILNENPSYEIDLKQISNDFEHLNNIDHTSIEKYKFDIRANRQIEKELGVKLQYSGKEEKDLIYYTEFGEHTPSYIITKRLYASLMSYYEDSEFKYVKLIDFEKSRENFYNNIEITRDITMLWAIFYSRLDHKAQTKIAKKYCTKHTIKTAFKVFSRSKNIEGLKWLAETLEA